jgi:hypothetical protein
VISTRVPLIVHPPNPFGQASNHMKLWLQWRTALMRVGRHCLALVCLFSRGLARMHFSSPYMVKHQAAVLFPSFFSSRLCTSRLGRARRLDSFSYFAFTSLFSPPSSVKSYFLPVVFFLQAELQTFVIFILSYLPKCCFDRLSARPSSPSRRWPKSSLQQYRLQVLQWERRIRLPGLAVTRLRQSLSSYDKAIPIT